MVVVSLRLRCLNMNNRFISKRLYQSTSEVRREFIRFFENHHHQHIPSSSVVPDDDPSLLFTNAGMNQFKSIFMGNQDGRFDGLQRAVNYQKCIRAGGKHNDLDDVGKDFHHQTFFEMLGNWSFNNSYDKKTACEMAWEFLTDRMRIDPNRLYVSYFAGKEQWGVSEDRECRDIWRNIGVPSSHILPFEKDNFWEMGSIGPCGPCTEIHYDRVNGRKDVGHLVNRDDSVVELWNIVFMSYRRCSSGLIHSLPSQHIDTGMGLERLVSVVQGVSSNYDIDTFKTIITKIEQLSKCPSYSGLIGPLDTHGRDGAYRLISDHLRAITVALSDGVQPGPVDAGFIIRKMLRRVFLSSHQQLQMERGSLNEVVPTIIETLKYAYPQLSTQSDWIIHTLKEEESQFWKILEKGKKQFMTIVDNLPKGTREISGDIAWDMHSTHGLPLEVIKGISEELGLKMDEKEYEMSRNRAKELSQSSSSLGVLLEINPSDFPTHSDSIKYECTMEDGKYEFPVHSSRIVSLLNVHGSPVDYLNKGDEGYVVLEKCQFYAEEGGQKCDHGQLLIDGKVSFVVSDVQKVNGITVLKGKSIDSLKKMETVEQNIDTSRRVSIMRAHSSTHLLNWALYRTGVGEGQRGSTVGEDYIRFDYATGENAGEDNSVAEVEELIGTVIARSIPIEVENIGLEKARGMKVIQSEFRKDKVYPSTVRVIRMGQDWTNAIAVECCAGTHVVNSSSIGDVVIMSDKSCAKGMRRIVGLCGEKARECRQYGASIVSRLRSLKSSSFSLFDVEEFRKSIQFDQLSFTDSKYINEQIRILKKSLKEEKKKRKKVEK